MWVEPDIELALAALSRGAVGREEILIARNARRRRVRTSEAGAAATTAGTGQQFNFHIDGFATRRVGHDHQCVLLGAIGQRADGCDLRVSAAGRLVIGRLRTVCAGASVRRAIGAGIFVDVKVIVRGAAAVIGPAHGHLDRSVWMRGMVTCGQSHRQCVIVAWLFRAQALGALVNENHWSGIGHEKWPGHVSLGAGRVGQGST